MLFSTKDNNRSAPECKISEQNSKIIGSMTRLVLQLDLTTTSTTSTTQITTTQRGRRKVGKTARTRSAVVVQKSEVLVPRMQPLVKLTGKSRERKKERIE